MRQRAVHNVLSGALEQTSSGINYSIRAWFVIIHMSLNIQHKLVLEVRPSLPDLLSRVTCATCVMCHVFRIFLCRHKSVEENTPGSPALCNRRRNVSQIFFNQPNIFVYCDHLQLSPQSTIVVQRRSTETSVETLTSGSTASSVHTYHTTLGKVTLV